MQAFEPLELEKVPIPNVPLRKVQVYEYRQDRGLGSAEPFISVMSICLIWLIMLVWLVASAYAKLPQATARHRRAGWVSPPLEMTPR
jgi:hypothetical protein